MPSPLLLNDSIIIWYKFFFTYRKVGTAAEFSSSKRIDFELYTWLLLFNKAQRLCLINFAIISVQITCDLFFLTRIIWSFFRGEMILICGRSRLCFPFTIIRRFVYCVHSLMYFCSSCTDFMQCCGSALWFQYGSISSVLGNVDTDSVPDLGFW